MSVDQARRNHERLLDALDAMHVLGVGVPIFYAAWRVRFAPDATDETAGQSWTRLKRWVRAALLPVRWVTETGPGQTAMVGVVFEPACRPIVVGLLDDLAAADARRAERRRAERQERELRRARAAAEAPGRLQARRRAYSERRSLERAERRARLEALVVTEDA